jgi:7,8-dihydroneopterin aldolase/epimerase/oxygenase
MKAKLLIEQLELHAYHGWYPHEGQFGQAFTIDLALSVDISRAAESDELDDAVDYAALVATTRRLFADERHKLVESAAVALGRGLLIDFPVVQDVHVRVRKTKPPIPERLTAAGVEVYLTRDDLKG